MSTIYTNDVSARVMQNREQAFRTNWLPMLHPDTDVTALPLPYLKDLYADIWLHGPRGEVYATQLRTMRAMLDRMLSDPTYEAPFLRDVAAFALSFDPYSYTYRVEIANEAASQYRLLPMRGLTYNKLHDDISLHVAYTAWLQGPGAPVSEKFHFPIGSFLMQFTYHSKNRDLIVNTPRDVDGLCTKFADYCEAWGIPT